MLDVQKLDGFIDNWQDAGVKTKAVFVRLKEALAQKDGVTLEFIARPGITYSLRAVHANQQEKPLFALVDVIEDDPRWLSVCFYEAMISDPEEYGDFVPGGLLGKDAICFDIASWDASLIAYVEARLDEAWQSASHG
jgi:hypothetical protein